MKTSFINVYYLHPNTVLGLGLWCLTQLSTIFQLCTGGGNRRKPSTCCKSLKKYCIEYTSRCMAFELTTFVVIDTDYTGSL